MGSAPSPTPPVIRTLPLASKVAVWPRGLVLEVRPVGLKTPWRARVCVALGIAVGVAAGVVVAPPD
jgi:hypothetical protein